jgi:hypothetical protein
MTSETISVVPPALCPENLHEAILDLTSPQDQKATSRRLVEKLASLSSGDVDLLELGQTPVRLQ